MLITLRFVLPVVLLVVWIWCVLDVIATDESRIEHLPKIVWLIVVLLFSLVGSIAWLVLGRPSGAGYSLGGRKGPRASRPIRRRRRAPGPPPEPPKPWLTPEQRDEIIRRHREQRQRKPGEEADPPSPAV